MVYYAHLTEEKTEGIKTFEFLRNLSEVTEPISDKWQNLHLSSGSLAVANMLLAITLYYFSLICSCQS